MTTIADLLLAQAQPPATGVYDLATDPIFGGLFSGGAPSGPPPSLGGGPTGGTGNGGVPGNPGNVVQLGRRLAAQRFGWTGDQWKSLYDLFQRESGWNPHAVNSSSGAAGIPQALPSAHPGLIDRQWMHDPRAQLLWGLRYIQQRYGSPIAAMQHETNAGWY